MNKLDYRDEKFKSLVSATIDELLGGKIEQWVACKRILDICYTIFKIKGTTKK